VTIMFKKQNSGFTLVEFMIVIALGAVAMTGYMQTLQQEANQLMAKKLGVQELAVYNGAVQKYLSANAGVNPASITGTFTGVNWLKDGAVCASGTGAEGYVPCGFLSSTGGSTTVGNMDFTTTVSFNAAATATSPRGLEARTVLSDFETNIAGRTAGGTLGLAALVASTTFNTSDFSGGSDAGMIMYCPDITPMPAAMLTYCGAERDTIVSYAFTNSETDIWLRTDHGNKMNSAIEFRGDSGTSVPASAADLDSIDSRNNRHIRNVARIYNINDSDNAGGVIENLIIGALNGDSASTIANNVSNSGVIIDANMEVLGDLYVDGDIDTDGTISADGDISTDSNVVAAGNVTGDQFIDDDDASRYLDPNGTSQLSIVDVSEIRAVDPAAGLGIRGDTINFDDQNSSPGVTPQLTGTVNASNLMIEKNGGTYSLEELLPNQTLHSTYIVRYGDLIPGSNINPDCGGPGNVRVFVQGIVDEIVTQSGVGGQIRRVTYDGTNYGYFPENANYTNPSNQYAENAVASLMFYCAR